MKNLLTLAKKSLLITILATYITGFSAIPFSQVALASETPASTTEASVTYAPCPTVSGASTPTGSAGYTYVFNPATCLWENAYYTWNPVTGATTARYDQTPILNAGGTAWEYPDWYYSPAKGAYAQSIVSIPVPPQLQPKPDVGTTSDTPAQPGIAGAQSQLNGGSTINGTGPNSTNAINGSGSTNANINLANNVSILTNLDSSAVSGNAYVLQNTNGGNASTGDANVLANYLNMIQSGWNPVNGISTFNAELYGNLFGDILFNPNAILNTGASSNNNISKNNATNLTLNVADNASIQNDVNLAATSGNATVSQNTNGGNATSGNATAVANIINMINSRIAAGESFIGNVNIYGDFNGDILLPPSILAELMNTGANSSNTIANNQTTNIDANINKNNSITNNLDLTANSGNASVTSNTNGGNATTGDASTNAKQANIIGQNTTGTKGLLVFVNVLGKWVGTLWNAPSSSTIAGTGANSNNNIYNNQNTNIDANIDQNYSITNNIDINSRSGDATVSQNTNGGNATSGDASSSVNLLNMIDSNMKFTDWFGVLFINVFGTWDGSFGVDTPSGDKPGTTTTPTSNAPSGSAGVSSGATSAQSKAVKNVTHFASNLGNAVTQATDEKVVDQATSSAVTTNSGASGEVASAVTNSNNGGLSNTLITLAIILACAGLLFGKQILAFCKGLLGR